MSKRLSALIVEDSEQDATLLVRELRRGGYDLSFDRVETPDAMRAALDDRSWDIVLSDYSMPRFSAPAALALVRERNLDLPFIIISGTVGEETAVPPWRRCVPALTISSSRDRSPGCSPRSGARCAMRICVPKRKRFRSNS